MTCTAAQYFSLNRMLLLAMGLWPYQQSKVDRLRFIFFFGILSTGILFQFTTFLTSKCTGDFVVKILSNAIIFTIFAIKYIFFAIKIETMKNLLTQFQNVFSKLKNKYENAIIEKYSYYAKRYTIVLTILCICGTSAFFVIPFLSSIIDVTLPINISRSRRLPLTTEYFVDQEKYFFLILLHLNIAFCIGIGALVATGSIFIAYHVHICGLFKIASYHIEHAMRVNMLQNNNPEKDTLILKEIICAVHIHWQAMKLSRTLVYRFEGMFLYLIVAGVTSLSLNLSQIFRIILTRGNVDEIFHPTIFAVIIIMYMFIGNYLGQNLTDHNKYLFVTVYNVQWYIAPLHIQRLILFLLQRSTRDFTMNIGGLFITSLENFGMLVKTSVSYFTVIYSMQ